MGRGVASIGTLAAVLLVACGGQAPATREPAPTAAPPAALSVLTGPWLANPVVLDPLIADSADRACRADPGFPGGGRMGLVDARGGGKLMAFYSGPAGIVACEYLEVDPTGKVTQSLDGVAGEASNAAPPGRLSAISATGNDGGETGAAWQEVHGRAGPGIARVVITVEDVGPVTATLRDGIFSAWWPIDERPEPRVWARDYVVKAFDVVGQTLDSYAKCGPGPC